MTARSNQRPTLDLQRADAAHHIHPFTNMAELNMNGTRVISRAKGIHVYDSEGKEYLDAMAGLWCVNIGYGRPELGQVAKDQMDQLSYYNTFFQTSHPPAIELAEKLAQLAPHDLDHIFFASSGSEANDTNIRLVRHYWTCLGRPEKKILISRENAYHGSSLGSGSLGGMASMHAQGGMPIPDVVHINQPYWYGEGGDQSPEEFGLQRARELEKIIEKYGSNKIAAFIAEPIQGAGGVIIPPASYWPEIQRICRENEILIIVDEVICGFGRLGQWFGSQKFSIRPDIITVAKGLSSGYQPIGGSIISKKIAETLENTVGEFAHGYTYSGHPVATAVALENLRIIEEERIIDKVANEVGPYLENKWKALEDHPLVGEARINGLIGALELCPDKHSRKPFKATEGTVGLITREICLDNGLIMRHVGDKMIISPPLVIEKSEIDKLAELIWQSLDESYSRSQSLGLL